MRTLPPARALPRTAALAAMLALGLTASAPPLAAAATATVRTVAPPATLPAYVEESRSAFEGQLRAGQVREAEFNKVAEHLHLLLRDGRHMLVVYPGHEQPRIQAQLLAAGVPVAVERTARAATGTVHHTLRYVAAAILVIVLLGLALLLIARRRRLAGAAAPPADSAE
jgi:hypothetical protein